jgi:hypothetical protein
MHVGPRFVFLGVLVLPLFLACFCSVASAASESDARLSIEAARNRIVECYEATANASGVGANVTELLKKLNEAQDLLSKADFALRSTHDNESAVALANGARAELTGFVVEANALRDAAVQERYRSFMINIVGSAVGAVATVCGGFAVWTVLKRRLAKAGGSVHE